MAVHHASPEDRKDQKSKVVCVTGKTPQPEVNKVFDEVMAIFKRLKMTVTSKPKHIQFDARGRFRQPVSEAKQLLQFPREIVTREQMVMMQYYEPPPQKYSKRTGE